MMGLPCSETEFCDRLSRTGPAASDYLAQFDLPDADQAERAAHWKVQWENGAGKMIAEPYRALAEQAQRLGCDVVRCATLADLRMAAGQAKVIVLVAHWKDAGFPASDFLPSFEASVTDRLSSRSEPLALWLKQALQPRRFLFWRRPGASPRDAFRKALHASIVEEARIEMPQTSAARRRDLLDSWFAGCIRPGNRLELFDGLHSKEAIAEALTGFEGVIDLTICTSTYLGDHIGARSRQRTRTVQFLELQEPAEAALRLQQVLRLAARHPPSSDHYLHDRLTVSELFPLAVEQALTERGIH